MKPTTLYSVVTVVFFLLFSACSKQDLTDLPATQPERISLDLLKQKLPDIHSKVDLNSFHVEDFTSKEGTNFHVAGYYVKEAGVVTGFYGELDGKKLYTAFNKTSISQIDLISEQQLVVPKVFDKEQNKLTLDFENSSLTIGSLADTEKGICQQLCNAAYLGCIVGCNTVAVGMFFASPLPSPVYVAILASFNSCRSSCDDGVLACLQLC